VPHLASTKDHHHGEDVATSIGMGLVGLLDPTQGLFVIEMGLAHWQQWWPKRHSLLPAASQTIQTKLKHSNEQYYGSAFIFNRP
jgi:hypothetical protein